ncbi:hypothetical protein GT614_03515 [Enterobacter hormaechei]|uniref:DUF5983 family protein n=1 Tax=Enterobacter hormaechei TaxID=158836 RepID=UPI0013718634|nr:DUF5983 family protein [Enterobacter hormaechei]MCC4570386.1 DUF5983 family protein [Enterobacter hormaechei subsp. hoffmannii]MCC4573504.1 DUF5983 family protein [Enterobacter hormaechei subsp. hoffmannii]MCC4578050.1 DUF5983 family protein [Enterobacter hormaechei subsp. hoffmannii]MCC4584022.1 DUF5983 family protein [Enterobacter hormaechei subsp. hoffmannii]MZJ51862.1 hypothetical protein [Enterobacter hormaechei]
MKLSLTVEADAVNILALNMGRIAVDIDGIELANLIDVVCDNGYSLRIADEPGELIVEDPLPHAARLNGIQCSTAHITCEDNAILDQITLQRHDGGDCDWILYTGYGFILRLNARLHPVLELKRLGLSKACRRLVVTLMRCYSADIIHFDASGEALPGFAAFDW